MIHVACQSSSLFAGDCAVMLRSLLSEHDGASIAVHLLHDRGLTRQDRSHLESIVRSFGAEWEPTCIPRELTDGFSETERFGGVTAWFRLLLARLLPDVERVLYLDADLLVLASVRELWETDLRGRCLAAVTQPLIPDIARRVVNELGLPHPSRYFNSGVMVMDLARLRASGLAEKAERVAREPSVKLPWIDQDVLNLVLWGERFDLHPRWNVMNPCFVLPARKLPWTPQQVAEARANPAIIHFIGPFKPWHQRLRHPYARTYFSHLGQTPWRDRPIEERTPRNRVLHALPMGVTSRYERLAYTLRRLRRRALPAGRQAFLRGLGRSPRAYGAARTAYRLVRGHAADQVLSALLDALDFARGGEVCFVQIGANDADWGDPLKTFVETSRWRGVMVEPVPFSFARLAARYGDEERIELVRAALADRDGETPFHYLRPSSEEGLPPWYDKLGSLSIDTILHPFHAEHIPDLEQRIVTERVRAITFGTLQREHPLPRLDLLQLDAEGYDDQILEQVDLRHNQPAVILYEHKHLPAERRQKAQARLRAGGYHVVELGPDTVCVHASAPLVVRLITRRAAGGSFR